MSTNHTGNPTEALSPSPAPLPGSVPVSVLPVDGDALSAASVAQPLSMPTDYLAYLMNGHFRSFEQENFVNGVQTMTGSGNPTNYGRLFVTASGGTGMSAVVGRGKAVLTLGSSTLQSAYVSPASGVFTVGTNGQLIFEVDYTPGVSFTNAQHYIGINTGGYPLTSAGTYVRVEAIGSGQWVLNVNGSTTTLTGFVAVIGTMQRIRLEMYSATSPVGIANSNTALTKVYVNNVLAGSANGAQLSGFLSAGMECATATTGTATVQTMTWQWNRF